MGMSLQVKDPDWYLERRLGSSPAKKTGFSAVSTLMAS